MRTSTASRRSFRRGYLRGEVSAAVDEVEAVAAPDEGEPSAEADLSTTERKSCRRRLVSSLGECLPDNGQSGKTRTNGRAISSGQRRWCGLIMLAWP